MQLHMNRASRRYRLSELVALLALGCGPTAPTVADPATAREALHRALDAWKEGRTADSLRSASPSIVVSDDRWRDGFHLERFDVDPSDRQLGYEMRVRVTLWLRDPKGKTVKQTSEYAVGTGSPYTIVRDEEF
jgi:hypothetical protein